MMVDPSNMSSGGTTRRIVIPYKPRDIFKSYHESDKRFSCTVAHRRAGKTVARINKLVKKAAICQDKDPRFGYLAPFYVQAKDIAWVYLKHYCQNIPNKTNESELSVTFEHNNSMIKLYGAENAERMRGVYFNGIATDEAQGISRVVLTQIILPTLADRKGWLDVSGTPKGWDNLLGELFKLAMNNPDHWFWQVLKASETGIIDAVELAQLRALMPENEYEQEFECSFDAAITGAVYGKWVSELEADGRSKEGIFDPELPVHTAWDLGYDDATAVWFWQRAGKECRLVDYYESSNQDIQHYCEALRKRDYKYGDHFVPHDAANKLQAARGKSIVQQAFDEGFKFKVIQATSQSNSHAALRKVLGNTWIDPVTCKDGLSALKQYQFEYDEDRKIHKSIPKHDWSSHACDAAEIIGQVFEAEKASEKPKPPKFLNDMTANELFWGPQGSNPTYPRSL